MAVNPSCEFVRRPSLLAIERWYSSITILRPVGNQTPNPLYSAQQRTSSPLAHWSLIKSRACNAEMRSDGKNLVNPFITGRRTFNSGSWTCSSNIRSSLDPESCPWTCSSNIRSSLDLESCPFFPSLKSRLASSPSCSHFGSHSGGNSPTKSTIDAANRSILTN
jgi:hypothetical protein